MGEDGRDSQRIIDAATDVFAARGFTAATVADIIEASGDTPAGFGSIRRGSMLRGFRR